MILWPFPGYHQDGNNHTAGNVFNEINDTLYRVDCQVISEIILRLVNLEFTSHKTRSLDKQFYLRYLPLSSLLRKNIFSNLIDILY